MNENDRLKKIRTEKGLTLAKFGDRIGLTPGAVSDMERGRRGITEQTRTSVCREFRVNREWLVNGTGEMFMPDASDEIEALAKRYNLSYGMQVFIEKLVNSSSAAQDAVIDLIIETAEAIKSGDVSAAYREKIKTFEEMTPGEIADQVAKEREIEKRDTEESDQSSFTA